MFKLRKRVAAAITVISLVAAMSAATLTVSAAEIPQSNSVNDSVAIDLKSMVLKQLGIQLEGSNHEKIHNDIIRLASEEGITATDKLIQYTEAHTYFTSHTTADNDENYAANIVRDMEGLAVLSNDELDNCIATSAMLFHDGTENVTAYSVLHDGHTDLNSPAGLPQENYALSVISQLGGTGDNSLGSVQSNRDFLNQHKQEIENLKDADLTRIDIYTDQADGVISDMNSPATSVKSAPLGAAYDKNAVVNYATTYFQKYNDANYPNWNDYGGDCANFASQCMHAGGKAYTIAESAITQTTATLPLIRRL